MDNTRRPSIGIADDTTEADRLKIFDYWQAQEAVRRWAERGRLNDRGIVRKGPYGVRDAIEDYLAEIAAEKSPRAVKGARYIFTASTLPEFGHLLVEDITPDLLNRWRNRQR